uniref:Uncharacterized protein n=1 Tax=Rhizophora mucronata TaxID=61149 RepID=A0A2P2NG87_RHIMU
MRKFLVKSRRTS